MSAVHKFKAGDIVWAKWPYKHPALRGMQMRWRKATITKQSTEYVPGTTLNEPCYEIAFLDNGFDRRAIGETRLRAFSPLELIADQID